MEPISCRTAFISDVHLGAVGCKTADVQEFLYRVQCEELYLVGDIIDGWVAKERRWQQPHTNVLRTLLGKSKHGVKIRYTPGNHDAFMRRLHGAELGFIEVDHSFVHRLPDGRELLVVHGDLFDPSSSSQNRLAWMAAWAYEYLQVFNNRLAKRRSSKGPKSDFPARLKQLSKTLFASREKFDDQLINHARSEGFDGVVCGHVHRPEVRQLEDGFLYANCGDWVESRTAILEDFEGNLRLMRWEEMSEQTEPEIAAKPSSLRFRSLGSLVAKARSPRPEGDEE